MLKKVVGSFYAHNSNFNEWKDTVLKYMSKQDFQEMMDYAQDIYDSEIGINSYVLKYDKPTNRISIISTPDWDIENEPTVGDSICVWKDENGEFKSKKIKCKNQIYHNKWQFVQPNYTGFDVEAAKERTKLWNSIPDIAKHKSRIGYRSYWKDLLAKNGIEESKRNCIKLKILEDIDEHEIPIGTIYPAFPNKMAYRMRGISHLSPTDRKEIQNIVTSFISSARNGQIWRTGGGFGSGAEEFKITEAGNGELQIGGKKLTRANVANRIFNGVELVGYVEHKESDITNFDPIFHSLGYIGDNSDTRIMEYSIEYTNKKDNSIDYRITINIGLIFDVRIVVYKDGKAIDRFTIPTRGRKPVKPVKSVDDIYDLDKIIKKLSLDILEDKWERY